MMSSMGTLPVELNIPSCQTDTSSRLTLEQKPTRVEEEHPDGNTGEFVVGLKSPSESYDPT